MNTVFLSGWSFSKNFLLESFQKAHTKSAQLLVLDSTEILAIQGISDANFDSQVIAQEIDRLLGKLKTGGPFHLVGWSMGGMLALIVANYSKLEISKISLINTTHNFLMGSEDRRSALQKLFTEVEKNGKEPTIIMRKFYHSLLKEHGSWTVARPTIESLLEQCAIYKNNTLLEGLRFLSITCLKDIASTIEIPCNIVAAEFDLLIPKSHGEMLHTLIVNSNLVEVKDSNHLLPIQSTSFFDLIL